MNAENSSKYAWWDPRRILRSILMLDDTPNSIALGTAIGVFVAFTPTVGIQMLLVLLVAGLCRSVLTFNKVAALIAVYISNPFTTIPIYWFSYKLGTFFVGGKVTYKQVTEILKYEGLAQWWDTASALIFDMGLPLLIGSAIIATVCSVISYPLMLVLARGYQKTSHFIGEEVVYLAHLAEEKLHPPHFGKDKSKTEESAPDPEVDPKSEAEPKAVSEPSELKQTAPEISPPSDEISSKAS